MSALDQVRALHAPVREHYSPGLVCEGEGWAGMGADEHRWPCPTAEIVYTSEEIRAEEAAADAAWKAGAPAREAARQARLDAMSPADRATNDMLRLAYDGMVESILRPPYRDMNLWTGKIIRG